MTTRVERLRARRRGRRLTLLSVALGVPSLVGVAGLVSAWVLMPPTPSTAPYEPPAATSSVVDASAQGGALDAASAALQQPAEDSAAGVGTAASSPTAPDNGAQAPTTVGRFVVGAVGLNVPLEQQAYTSTLIPAGYTSAYSAVGSGWGGDSQPTLITLHSCSARTDCPGNALTQQGRATVEVGQAISVDGRTYGITAVEIRAKDDIANSPAWDNLASASLVVVTCSPDGGTHSISNLVLRAEEITG